jgi:sugar/nucleoside kinase (ribokinase family)
MFRRMERKADLDLLVVGEINPDVIVTGDDPSPVFGQVERIVSGVRLEIGSSSAIFAAGAARLGLRTAFVGVVGDDELGAYMLRALTDAGVDVGACRVDRALPTGASVILARPDDRAILTAMGAIGAVRADDVPAALRDRARHLHVGSYFLLDALRPDLPAIFAAARERGIGTSLDCNWDPSGTWDGGIADALAVTDVLFVNEEEARRLGGHDDAWEAAAALARDGLTVVVKRGADGALALSGGERAAVGSLPVDVVDTTGAGDSFDAGFVRARLDGASLHDCLRLGAACGSLSTRAAGGTRAQPDHAEAAAAAAALA